MKDVEVLEAGEVAKWTACQLCGRSRLCDLVLCDTTHLRPKGWKKRGHEGSATLSVCGSCEKRFGKKGGR